MSDPIGRLVSVLVTAPAGLHARPAIKLSRLARRFKADLRVRAEGDGEWVDAKSLVRLMGLKVEEGTHLEFAAEGDDSGAMLEEVRALVTRNFEDAEDQPHG
ncbi:MAG: HPr family phosphocarrier protein [Sphingomonas sp.]